MIFWCLWGTFFDMFGVLGDVWTCLVSWGALGCQNQSNLAFHWSPFGSISAPFFDENRVFFHALF